MKKLFTLLVSGLTFTLAAQPPDADALENVIVEKYYVAGPADVQSGLPLGATTYRVFLDLKPGYELQQINASPPHPIAISAPGGGFYNSEYGATFGSDFLPILLNFGTAVLDSYVTIKASTQSKGAITKNLDTDGTLLTGDGGFLQNNDPNAGIPLLQADGFIPIEGTVQPVSQIGLGGTLLSEYFGLANSAGTSFENDNGAWFNLDGIKADTDDNLVCVGQFTTLTCEFSFKLNIQVIIPEEIVMLNPQYSVIRFVAVTHPEDADLNASNDNFYIYQKDFLNFSVTAQECLVSSRDIDVIENDWSLMPNPASDLLQLSLSKEFQDVSYAIYDMSGKLLKNIILGNQGANSKLNVNIEDIQAGIYLIQLRTGDSVSAKKFIITR